ncbi:hypothetical protein P0Y67_05100 [Photobacterium sp. SP02]|uniref:hypothetical protein n=1 Tax=Photobacterium sp. SP02 TaxID=3032280 RepID=UPI003145670F
MADSMRGGQVDVQYRFSSLYGIAAVLARLSRQRLVFPAGCLATEYASQGNFWLVNLGQVMQKQAGR